MCVFVYVIDGALQHDAATFYMPLSLTLHNTECIFSLDLRSSGKWKIYSA